MKKKSNLAIALIAAAALLSSGCNEKQSTVLGAPVPSQSITPIASLKSGAQLVTIHGVMVQKCPIAGCWFNLRDKTDQIKVDTKNAGFVVMNVPLNTEMTVAGRLSKNGDRLFEATGCKYD